MSSQPGIAAAIKARMKWRYLDSLDSTRYSQTEFIDEIAPIVPRVEQARAELAATILMGNGIIVPNNQLMDSVGFLRNASEIITAATSHLNRREEVFVPIKFAKFDYPKDPNGGKKLEDPFSLAAFLFDKDGQADHGYFELSAWDDFAARRRELATILRENKPIPPKFAKNAYEEQRLHELIRVLQFFSANKGERVVQAAPTAGIRESMTGSIADLSKEALETDSFFVKLLTSQDASDYGRRLKILIDIVEVFNKLRIRGLKSPVPLELLVNRSRQRNALVNEESYFFGHVESLNVRDARKGVLKTFNSIYNYSGFKSTRAEQDNQTEPMQKDRQWGYDEAAFALGEWAREKFEILHTGPDAGLDISSNQDSFVDPLVSVSVDESDGYWKEFFDFELTGAWNTSTINSINSLRELEDQSIRFGRLPKGEQTDESRGKLRTAIDAYLACRREHIRIVNPSLPAGYKIQIGNDDKAYLMHFAEDGKVISRIQLENFADLANLTKEDKAAFYAAEPAADDTTGKGRTAEYADEQGTAASDVK